MNGGTRSAIPMVNSVDSSPHWGAISPVNSGTAIPCQGYWSHFFKATRGGISSLVGDCLQDSKGCGQLSMTLALQHVVLMGPCGNTGNGYQHRPQWQQHQEPRQDHLKQLGPRYHHDPVQSSQIRMGSVFSLSSNMVPGGSTSFGGNNSHRY